MEQKNNCATCVSERKQNIYGTFQSCDMLATQVHFWETSAIRNKTSHSCGNGLDKFKTFTYHNKFI